MNLNLFEMDEKEECVEPIITLRDKTQLIVVMQADSRKLYRLVKQPNGIIIMIPYNISSVEASAGGPDQQKYNATTISPSLVKEGSDSSRYDI